MIRVNEEKSINADIVNLSDLIADKILKQVPLKRVMVSDVTGDLFVEGEFVQSLYGEIDGLDKLNVRYILYMFENVGEYNHWVRMTSVNGEPKNYNSYADYHDQYLQIVSAYINDEIMYDFAENILHEITHLFQYGKGMEKRVNLYDSAVKLCTSINQVAQAVGRTVYYTFKHEQDAMVHQFYGRLLQTQTTDTFEEAIKQSEYKNAQDYLLIVKRNRQDANKYIKSLGLSEKQYNTRIYYGYRRFEQKLYNAYVLYSQHKNDTNPNLNESFEINMSRRLGFDKFLMEARKKYGEVNFGRETIYQF